MGSIPNKINVKLVLEAVLALLNASSCARLRSTRSSPSSSACALRAALTAAVYGFVLMLPLMSKASPDLHRVQLIFTGGAFANFCLWAYLIFAGVDAKQRSSTLGSWATVIFIILAASPLSPFASRSYSPTAATPRWPAPSRARPNSSPERSPTCGPPSCC
mgnify:CR=1 FL=1